MFKGRYAFLLLVLAIFLQVTALVSYADQGQSTTDTEFKKGDKALREGQYQQALHHFQAVTRSDPWRRGVWYRLVKCYKKLNRLDDALVDLKQGLAKAPDNPEIYRERGDVWKEKKNFDKALADYNKAITLDPDSALLYSIRGSVLQEMDNCEKAIADFDKAEHLDPDMASYVVSERHKCHVNLGKLEEAIADCKKLIELFPKRAVYRLILGNTYLKAGKPQKALAAYEDALKIKPSYKLAQDKRDKILSDLKSQGTHRKGQKDEDNHPKEQPPTQGPGNKDLVKSSEHKTKQPDSKTDGKATDKNGEWQASFKKKLQQAFPDYDQLYIAKITTLSQSDLHLLVQSPLKRDKKVRNKLVQINIPISQGVKFQIYGMEEKYRQDPDGDPPDYMFLPKEFYLPIGFNEHQPSKLKIQVSSMGPLGRCLNHDLRAGAPSPFKRAACSLPEKREFYDFTNSDVIKIFNPLTFADSGRSGIIFEALTSRCSLRTDLRAEKTEGTGFSIIEIHLPEREDHSFGIKHGTWDVKLNQATDYRIHDIVRAHGKKDTAGKIYNWKYSSIDTSNKEETGQAHLQIEIVDNIPKTAGVDLLKKIKQVLASHRFNTNTSGQ